MNITKLTLTNARMAYTLAILLVSLGLMVYSNFPSREDPLVRINKAMITTQFPGMPAEKIELLITQKIEQKLRELGDIEFINSTSKTGVSIINISAYEHLEDFDKLWQQVRQKLMQTQHLLPAKSIGPNLQDEFGDVAIVTAALTGKHWPMSSLRMHARAIKDRIYGINGIKRVTLHGVQKEHAYIEADAHIIENKSINMREVANSIQDQNNILPAGKITTHTKEITLETSGELVTLPDLLSTEIPAINQNLLPITDVFNVRSGYVEPISELAYFNGKPAIIIAASMQAGQNILQLGPRLNQLLTKLDQELPVGMQLQIATFQADVVDSAITNVKSSLYQTLFIVLTIVILSLGISEGLIVGITVPITILASLLVMYFVDINLQFISLASLIIALGMLVDNAIVITENIHLRLQTGEEKILAATKACKELALPLLTSTLTTVLAFAPMLFANTTAGEYTRSLAQVVSISLIISWLVSLTIVPLLAVHFIKVKTKTKAFFLLPYYQQFIGIVLSHPKKFISVISIIFAFSLYILTLVPVEMFSTSSRSEVLVYIDLPAGYNASQTQKATQKLTHWLQNPDNKHPVDFVSAYIGNGGPRFFLSIIPNTPSPNNAFMIVKTHSADDALIMQKSIRKYAASELAHTNVRTELIARGTVPPGVVQLRFSGPDAGKLFAMSKKAQLALASIPGAIHVRNNWENHSKRYRVTIDAAKARRANVSYQAISEALQATLSGIEITQLRQDDTLIPIIIKMKNTHSNIKSTANPLDLIKVSSKNAENSYILLSQIAEIESVAQFGSIVRRNLTKTITVEGKHLTLKAPELQALWDAKLASLYQQLPPGYSIELGGELEGFKNSAGTLFVTFPLFLGLILAILISQFNSFRKTAIVLLTIPLAFSGGFIGLFLTNANFDFIGALGFISLAGIIINNAIVLIDKISDEERKGKTKIIAIQAACSNRLRPILITTVTTVLALIPLMTMQESLFYSMASVIIFGMSIGTLMTLGLVPALYALLMNNHKNTNTNINNLIINTKE